MDESKELEEKKKSLAEGEGSLNVIFTSLDKQKEEKPVEFDEKSICVKNVNYKASKADLEEHFNSCGTIHRLTICKDVMTGRTTGY